MHCCDYPPIYSLTSQCNGSHIDSGARAAAAEAAAHIIDDTISLENCMLGRVRMPGLIHRKAEDVWTKTEGAGVGVILVVFGRMTYTYPLSAGLLSLRAW